MKKKTFHFNSIDVVLVILIFTCVALLFNGLILKNSKISLQEKHSLRMSVMVKDVPDNIKGEISRGDVVRLSDDFSKIGVISDNVTYTKSYKFEDFDNKNISAKKVYYYPDSNIIKFDIECDWTFSGGDYYIIGDNKYNVSDTVDFCVPGYSGKFKITAIEVIE